MSYNYFFVFFLVFCQVVAADPFVGEVATKGVVKENVFTSDSLELEITKDSFLLRKDEIREVSYDIEIKSLKDFIFESERNRLVAFVSYFNNKKIEGVLFVGELDGSFTTHRVPYPIVENYVWIEELGALSRTGKFLLCKCAGEVAVEKDEHRGNMKFIYSWVILSFEDDAVEVVCRDGAFSKWNDFVRL